MRLIRRRRASLNTLLGITQAKSRVARATGIPTTRSGRKRKALNALTGGGYGKYQRARASYNRLFRPTRRRRARRASAGCLVTLIELLGIAALALILLL